MVRWLYYIHIAGLHFHSSKIRVKSLSRLRSNTVDLFVGKTFLHGDALTLIMKTLLTSWCVSQWDRLIPMYLAQNGPIEEVRGLL